MIFNARKKIERIHRNFDVSLTLTEIYYLVNKVE